MSVKAGTGVLIAMLFVVGCSGQQAGEMGLSRATAAASTPPPVETETTRIASRVLAERAIARVTGSSEGE